MNGHTLTDRQLAHIQANIDVSGACHLYRCCINAEGYAIYRSTRVHRLMLERKLGRAILPGHLACHICVSHRNCVNPDHLYEGTPSSNMQDRIRDGHHTYRLGRRGKLSNEQILAIRADTRGSYEIGEQYGVDPSYVRAIRRGRHRTKVTLPGTDTPGSSSLNAASPQTDVSTLLSQASPDSQT